jgi:hypothetical protein
MGFNSAFKGLKLKVREEGKLKYYDIVAILAL